jgi:hypothetical protein
MFIVQTTAVKHELLFNKLASAYLYSLSEQKFFILACGFIGAKTLKITAFGITPFSIIGIIATFSTNNMQNDIRLCVAFLLLC